MTVCDMKLLDLVGNELHVGQKVLYTEGRGTLATGRIDSFPKRWGKWGPGHMVVDGVRLKLLSRHKKIDDDGNIYIDRVYALERLLTMGD